MSGYVYTYGTDAVLKAADTWSTTQVIEVYTPGCGVETYFLFDPPHVVPQGHFGFIMTTSTPSGFAGFRLRDGLERIEIVAANLAIVRPWGGYNVASVQHWFQLSPKEPRHIEMVG